MIEILECQRWCVEQIQTYYAVSDNVLFVQAFAIVFLILAYYTKKESAKELLMLYSLGLSTLYLLVKLYQIFVGML